MEFVDPMEWKRAGIGSNASTERGTDARRSNVTGVRGPDICGDGPTAGPVPWLRRFGATGVVLSTFAVAAPVPVHGDGEPEREVSATSLVSSADTKDLYPVVVIDRTDIELSGMRNLWDLLRSRVDYNYLGLHRPFGIDSLRLAVTVNGRRISDSTRDLDALPISAVERIEIIGGNSVVVHGPHALAGAINIVLRDRFEGVEVQIHGETPVDAGAEAGQASALWGGAVGDGHLMFGADVFRRNEIRRADRDYSRPRWTPGGSFADTRWVSAFGNTAIVPGAGARSIGNCEGNGYTGPLSDPFGILGEGCGFAWADIAWSWEHRERQTAFLALDHPLGGDDSLYLDARVASTDVTSPYAAPTPALIFLRSGLQSGSGENRVDLPPGTLVLHRFVGQGDRAYDWNLREYDFTLGVEGRLGAGIGYDAHLRSYLWDVSLDAGNFVHRDIMYDEIVNGRYNLAAPTDPANDRAIRRSAVRLSDDQVTKHRVARVAFDGTGPELGGGAIGWAAGAEFVYESRRLNPIYRDGGGNVVDPTDVAGSHPFNAVAFRGARDRLSEFAEISLSLHDDWDVVLGGRHDDQDDVGSTVSSQLATRFRVNHGLSLRGSVGSTEKPPILAALNAAPVVTNPRIFDRTLGSGYTVTAINSGNPDLEPDEADSLSLGVVGRLGPVTLSGDWYRTSLSRMFALVTAQAVVDYEFRHRTLPEGVEIIRYRDPETYRQHRERFPECPERPLPIPGTIACIVKPLTDDGEFDIAGVNLRAQWGWTTDWAEYDLDAHWSHVSEYEFRAYDIAQSEGFPRNRVHVALGATRGDQTLQWSAYGMSGYRSAGGRFGGWIGHDVSVRWRNPFGIDATDLTGGIMNVGNRGPSIHSEDPEDPDLTFDAIRGQTIFVTLKRSW